MLSALAPLTIARRNLSISLQHGLRCSAFFRAGYIFFFLIVGEMGVARRGLGWFEAGWARYLLVELWSTGRSFDVFAEMSVAMQGWRSARGHEPALGQSGSNGRRLRGIVWGR